MSGPNDLTNLTNAYGWLGIPTGTDDDVLTRLITAMSSQVQKWLGYNALQASYTRTFNGQGIRKLFVPDIPLVSVQSLVVNQFPVPAGAVSGNAQQSGYYNDQYGIELIGYFFHRGISNIQAVYTSGYAAGSIPPEFEQAVLEWIKISYARKTMPGIGGDVIAIKAGDTSINWGGSGSVTNTQVMPMPSVVYGLLMPYRRLAMIPGY